MHQLKLAIIILLIVGMAAFGFRAILGYVFRTGIHNRALPDMMALAAAVEYFRQSHGRLPSPEEFGGLHPAPGFHLPFASKSPETQTLFVNPSQCASEVTDPFRRPYFYEPDNDKFVIRSNGPDGIKSNDDFIYEPATK